MEEEPIAERFQQTQAFIEEARSSEGKVLLHCHEGVSRSVTLATSYLMLTQVRRLNCASCAAQGVVGAVAGAQ